MNRTGSYCGLLKCYFLTLVSLKSELIVIHVWFLGRENLQTVEKSLSLWTPQRTEVRAADLWSEQLAISFSLIKPLTRLSTFYIKTHINREPSVFHQIPFSAYYQQHTA